MFSCFAARFYVVQYDGWLLLNVEAFLRDVGRMYRTRGKHGSDLSSAFLQTGWDGGDGSGGGGITGDHSQ